MAYILGDAAFGKKKGKRDDPDYEPVDENEAEDGQKQLREKSTSPDQGDGRRRCCFPNIPSWIFGPLQVLLYYAIGLLYYASSDTQWDAHTAFYFTSISITTVGYGDFSPKSDVDKLFTIFYVVFGFISVYAVISDAMTGFFEKVERKIKSKKKEESVSSIPPDDEDVKFTLRRQRILYIVLIFLLQLGGALVVCLSEEWSFVDGLYWAFQTTSTVGYGDEFLHKRSRIFGALYALASVGTLAACFAGLSAAKQQADAERHYRKLMRHELNQDLILKLDKNGDGVSRAEFLMGMLVAMDLVSERECLGILNRFDELDADGSGRLDGEDLAKIAESYAGPARAKADTDSPPS